PVWRERLVNPLVLILAAVALVAITTAPEGSGTLTLDDERPAPKKRTSSTRKKSTSKKRTSKKRTAKKRTARTPAADDSGSAGGERKSTRLNSSHVKISYAAFCLKH